MSRHNADLHARAVSIAVTLFPGTTIERTKAGLLVDGQMVLVRATVQRMRNYARRSAAGQRYTYTYPVLRWNMHMKGLPVTTPWRWVLVAQHGTHMRTWVVPGPALRGLTHTVHIKHTRPARMDSWEVTP